MPETHLRRWRSRRSAHTAHAGVTSSADNPAFAAIVGIGIYVDTYGSR
jgi:hypothetical protein